MADQHSWIKSYPGATSETLGSGGSKSAPRQIFQCNGMHWTQQPDLSIFTRTSGESKTLQLLSLFTAGDRQHLCS